MMEELLTNEVALGLGTAALALLAGGAYSRLTGQDAEVDIDNDGESEVVFEGSPDDEFDIEPADPNPIPDAVFEKNDMTDVKGIGPTRAERLREAGYESVEDLYYASDAGLGDVKGIGDLAISHIREDIGAVDSDTAADERIPLYNGEPASSGRRQ